jgi:hypothetical protein
MPKNEVTVNRFGAPPFGLRPHKQGSTFRVKDKQGIKDPKPSLKMLIRII